MKKFLRSLLCCLLIVFMTFNVVACEMTTVEDDDNWWDDAYSQAGEWWGDVGDWWDDAYSQAGEWWDGAYSQAGEWWDDAEGWWGENVGDLETFWENATTEISDWIDEAKELGDAAGNYLTEKFNQLSEYVLEKSDEVQDSVVTGLAQAVYNHAHSGESEIPKSNKTFEDVSLSGYSSDDLENLDVDYTYDTEAFVYGLIEAVAPASCELFAAKLTDNEGEYYLGIAYTDYSRLYKDDEGNSYYLAGFMSLVGEPTVENNGLNSGLEIERLDGLGEEETTYVYSYKPEAFETHCVALGKYFTFGVDENASIFYEMVDYTGPSCIDQSLGELYSFDVDAIIANQGEESYFTSSAAMEKMRYDNRSVEEIKESLYEELDKIKIDFSSINIGNIFESVKKSVAAAFAEGGIVNTISQLTLNDVLDTDIFSANSPDTVGEIEKWVVMSCCIVVVVLTIAVHIFMPALRPLMGGIAGAVCEIFVEVVIAEGALADLDFRKVAIAALAGAISINTGILGDALIGGIADATMTLIDGCSFENAIESFFNGCVAGVAFGLAFAAIGKIVGAIAGAIAPNFRKTASNFVDSDQIVVASRKIVNVDDVSADASKYSAKKAVQALDADKKAFKETFQATALKQIPSVKNKSFRYIMADGVTVSVKKELNGFLEFTDDMSESVRKLSKNQFTNEAVTRFKLRNGVAQMDEVGAGIVWIDNMTVYRKNVGKGASKIIGNFEKADQCLADLWGENPDLIPDNFLAKILRDHPTWKNSDDFLDLTDMDIRSARKELRYTWHEQSISGKMVLVPMQLHAAIKHAGAVAGLKLLKVYSRPEVFKYAKRYVF